MSNTSELSQMEVQPSITSMVPLWMWILILIVIITFLIWKIGQKFQYNLEAMFFIQLLLLLQLWLSYVEVFIRTVITSRFISTKPFFIIELIHFCILMNRDILLLIQQGIVR